MDVLKAFFPKNWQFFHKKSWTNIFYIFSMWLPTPCHSPQCIFSPCGGRKKQTDSKISPVQWNGTGILSQKRKCGEGCQRPHFSGSSISLIRWLRWPSQQEQSPNLSQSAVSSSSCGFVAIIRCVKRSSYKIISYFSHHMLYCTESMLGSLY